jgi:hypothetical protein
MRVGVLVAMTCLTLAVRAGAADVGHLRADDQQRASEAYKRGVALSLQAQWGEALGAFELADSLVHHPQSTYNIGACERVLGHYTRAREYFGRALADHRAGRALLPQDEKDARRNADELERLFIARVSLRLSPANVAVTVDGRPLAKRQTDVVTEWVGNLEAPGVGKHLDSLDSLLILDPGAHVFTFSRKGYRDVVRTETFSPGEKASRSYELERLPSVMHISSDRAGAVVTVDDLDVGSTPVSVERPAGRHTVLVRSVGYVPYQASVTLGPGEQSNMRAMLPAVKPSVLSRWWFWATAGAVVAGVTAATYVVTRPEPGQTPTNCGSTGWCVQVR